MLEAQTRTNIVITDQTTCFGPYQNQGMFSVITTLAHIKKNNRRTRIKIKIFLLLIRILFFIYL